MKTAMAVSSSRHPHTMLVMAAYVASMVSLLSSPGVATAWDVSGSSNLLTTLQKDSRFSLFYMALQASGEILSMAGRTEMNDSSLIVFAPTDESLYTWFPGDILDCLQSGDNYRDIFSPILRYCQVTTPNVFPVQNPQDLLKVAREGQILTVLGKPISVDYGPDGSVMLTSDNGVDVVTVSEVRVTDPQVALVPLFDGVLVPQEASEKIELECLGIMEDELSPIEEPIAAPGPSSYGAQTPPSSGPSVVPPVPRSGASAAPPSEAAGISSPSPAAPKSGYPRRLRGLLY